MNPNLKLADEKAAKMIDMETDQRMRRYIAEQHKTIAELRRYLDTLQEENRRLTEVRLSACIRLLAGSLTRGIRSIVSKSRQWLQRLRIAVISQVKREGRWDLAGRPAQRRADSSDRDCDVADDFATGSLDVNELRRALVRFTDSSGGSGPVYQAVLADSHRPQ